MYTLEFVFALLLAVVNGKLEFNCAAQRAVERALYRRLSIYKICVDCETILCFVRRRALIE